MSTASFSSEADILRRAFDQTVAEVSAEVLSCIDFAPEDHEQMHRLAGKAREGSLSEEERSVLHHYEVVNDLLGILRSRARISLQRSGERAD